MRPRRHRRFVVFSIHALLALAPHAARAQAFDAPSVSPPSSFGTEQAVTARYWELGRTRPFLASSIEVGFPYVRPRFYAGYGRPFWSFVGVEAYPALSAGGIGSYFGGSFALPGFTLRGGARYFYPLTRTLLSPDEHFTRIDLDLEQGPTADYLAYEAEATVTAPLFSGSVFGVLTGYRLGLVPDGYYVFEENLHVIAEPPYVWRARAGYLLALSRNGSIRIGAAGEIIGLPGRDEFVVRAGVLGSVLVTAQIEAQVSLIPVIASPDSLGIVGGDFGQLGIRYTWATGSEPDAARLDDAVRDGERKR
jgi:hypothetical protein